MRILYSTIYSVAVVGACFVFVCVSSDCQRLLLEAVYGKYLYSIYTL